MATTGGLNIETADLAWEQARAAAREAWPDIVRPFEETLRLQVDSLPMLLGVRSDYEETGADEGRRASPFKLCDKVRRAYANELKDAFEGQSLDEHPRFREVLNEVLDSAEGDTSRRGSFLIVDDATAWLFSEESSLQWFSSVRGTPAPDGIDKSEQLKKGLGEETSMPEATVRGKQIARVSYWKKRLDFSHFLYIPGFTAGPWRTFFLVGLKRLELLRFRYTEMAEVCAKVRLQISRCEHEEAAHASKWGAELEAIAKEIGVKEKNLAVAISLNTSTFSNKKQGKDRRHFTTDQQQRLVAYLVDAADGNDGIWGQYPLLDRVRQVMAEPKEA